MCGIVGAVAKTGCVLEDILHGLMALEYRGYDSAGIAYVDQTGLQRFRTVARVQGLRDSLPKNAVSNVGIAHTRWATHGKALLENAHPHISGRFALVHNGIIENHDVLRAQLLHRGYLAQSETDTEVIVQLIDAHMCANDCRLVDAVRQVCCQLEGSFAIVVMDTENPSCLVAAKQGSPLIIGIGEDIHFIASDLAALSSMSKEFVFLQENDCAEITPRSITVFNPNNSGAVARERVSCQVPTAKTALGGFDHHMQKEIFEQPGIIRELLGKVILGEEISVDWFGSNASEVLKDVSRVLIIACGTSYHAGLVAKYWLEEIAQISTQVEIASEYRYRIPVILPGDFLVVISQSGETADTIAALRYAKSRGVERVLAICNVAESTLVRESDLHFLTQAGQEIGVASTKGFSTQLVVLFLWVLVLAKQRGMLSSDREQEVLSDLRKLPVFLQSAFTVEKEVQAWAQRLAEKPHALFLGRGIHYPIALEGALKLKEISYIHAEAYAAGELKHGPLALVDEQMPVVVVAPNDNLLRKVQSNMQEVRARGGELYVFTDKNIEFSMGNGLHLLELLDNARYLSPIIYVIPLQLLAYHTAVARGTDVDKPRNLAKSVTVE